MTTNQIAYAKLKEETRHNLATEGETNRSNIAKEVETNRSNVAKETETTRHNLTTEIEENRHHKADETEKQRSNKANEALGNKKLALDALKALPEAYRNFAQGNKSNIDALSGGLGVAGKILSLGASQQIPIVF